MKQSSSFCCFSALLLAVAVTACAAAKDSPATDAAGMAGMDHMHMGDSSMAMDLGGLAEPVVPPGSYFIAADVKFMQGMIGHHGQAVVMAAMAKNHGANDQMLRFTLKIAQSQTAEIGLMQNWLYEREQEVPDTNAWRKMKMPGMLTDEQMKELDAAKGKAFDKLFLIYMIQHHEGAIKMVAELQQTPLSRQDALLSAFSADVDTDQRAEIFRMHQMLDEMNQQ